MKGTCDSQGPGLRWGMVPECTLRGQPPPQTGREQSPLPHINKTGRRGELNPSLGYKNLQIVGVIYASLLGTRVFKYST